MDHDARVRRFRFRLLAAFGVGLIPGLIYAPDADAEAQAETTQCYMRAVDEVACLATGMEEAIKDRLEIVDGPCSSSAVLSVVTDGVDPQECCYVIEQDNYGCDFDDDTLCNGCYGRPYMDHEGAAVVAAPSVRAASWDPASATLRPDLDGLDADQRAALAEFWADNARAEHSSVAGFHRVCLELIAHAAPLELLERSQRAAADELAHARVCYALASHYAGAPLGPGPMPLGTSAPLAASLLELAVATAREGCLAETSAAWLAAELAATASDPAVAAALEQIAADEAEHAELAWMTLRWAIDAGGPEVREAVAQVFAAARPTQMTGSAIRVPGHGLLSAAEVQAIVDRGFRELLAPVMRAA